MKALNTATATVADTMVHVIVLFLAWLMRVSCESRMCIAIGAELRRALGLCVGWLAGRIHNLAQLRHALIFYCCCFAGCSNFLWVAHVEQMSTTSGLGSNIFQVWVSHFSHFGSQFWCKFAFIFAFILVPQTGAQS